MPLTLEQYVDFLDHRGQLWPVAEPAEPVRAKPHLKPLREVRCVLWTAYGTLLNVLDGEIVFNHPQTYVQTVALQKTVEEFKMWGSMYRKPGAPAELLKQMYDRTLFEAKAVGPVGEKYPEIDAAKVWEGVIKKLMEKGYAIDAGNYGSLNEFARKVAYFFHASLQGCEAYPGVADALAGVSAAGLAQGLLTDGQSFTPVQLARAIRQQRPGCEAATLVDPGLQFVSYQFRARKPSETLLRAALTALAERGIEPGEVLHVGSRLSRDLAPAKRLGMRVGLFAGDKASLDATPEMLKDPACRPDVLLTDPRQVLDVVG
jgi:FMN phosphatase YigB (HAD superfamily)